MILPYCALFEDLTKDGQRWCDRLRKFDSVLTITKSIEPQNLGCAAEGASTLSGNTGFRFTQSGAISATCKRDVSSRDGSH